jgi:hypothetical protein
MPPSVLSVTFESGSKRSCIEDSALSSCSSLSSICLPSPGQGLGKDCFSGGLSLATLRFESGSGQDLISSPWDFGCTSCRLYPIYVIDEGSPRNNPIFVGNRHILKVCQPVRRREGTHTVRAHGNHLNTLLASKELRLLCYRGHESWLCPKDCTIGWKR